MFAQKEACALEMIKILALLLITLVITGAFFLQKWVTITLLSPSDKKELQKDPKECGFEAFIT